MGLYSQTIKNIVSGVSQQPPILRLPEQLEEQLNGMSTEVGGLQKRPPTLHVAKLDAPTITGDVKPLIHLIDRDQFEKYVVIFDGSGVNIWDLQGNKKVVNYSADAKDYLSALKPRQTIKAVTIADYTFIVNTEKVVNLSTETTPNVWGSQGGLVNVKSGQYGRTYKIIVNGITEASWASPDGSTAAMTAQIDTNYIASQLATLMAAKGYTVTSGEGWLYFTKSGLTITSIDTHDGYNNLSMFGILRSVQRFNMLPASAPNGFTVMVQGDPGSNSDDYYISYDSTDRVWKETAKPGILCSFDASTMPHNLIRQSDGTFLFTTAEWVKRKVGDDDSNPAPSFVGNKIKDIFFFRNRLGFVAGENAILSKSSEFFQFWMSSATDILDIDPIDLAVSSDSVSILNHAVPFNEELLLFSNQAQFLLQSSGVLSPKTSSLSTSTAFECNPIVRPVGAGRNVYFPTERAQFTSIKEYYAVQNVTNIKNAQDITSHVPSYIPNGVHVILSNTTENVLLVLTEGEENSIYVYKYLFIEEQRVQASWSKWSFGETSSILGGKFIGSTLYLIIKRGNSVFLEKMLFTYNTKDYEEEPYRIFLDRKTITPPIPVDNYNNIYDFTTIDIKALYGGDILQEASYGVITPDGFYRSFSYNEITNGTVKLQGNISGKSLTVGGIFTFRIVFAEFMLKTLDQNGGTKADVEGRLQLKNCWVNYDSSGVFKVIVEHFNKQNFTYEMTSRILGSGNNILGVIPSETGKFKFPIQSLSSNCRVSVESDAPVPVALIGSGWEGNFYRRSRPL